MSFAWKFASSRGARYLPAAAALLSHQSQQQQQQHSDGTRLKCEAAPAATKLDPASDAHMVSPLVKPTNEQDKAGMKQDAHGDYHGLFPLRQKWEPKLEYPLWDQDWDGRSPIQQGSEEEQRRRMRHIRKTGVTRHIIMVRHGQYDETHKEDELRTLTQLGKLQAELTGKRLASLVQGGIQAGIENADVDGEQSPPCNIKVLRVSGMKRAIETADIIASHLPGVVYEEPDPLLSEGRPCHHIPGSRATDRMIQATDEGHERIEQAFEKYFHRADFDQDAEDDGQEKHEFEIIVCHANVIRYFLCRALQLPPEAWLRYCPFNCSLTYLTIRPTGSVSCRMLGDVGHLPYDASTFSQHHGFVW